jgi:hypothetical protein
MLKEIIDEIESAIDVAYNKMCKEDYISYILLIGRADIMSGLKCHYQTDCVIDYQLDRYYDKTREGFYLRYLNRNYIKEGFNYDGDEGIDDLSIEMMIYDHLWDSSYFLKSLVRIASILSGKGYNWNPDIPEKGKWDFMHSQIIDPLKENGVKLGEIVENGYSSDIRNAFAHSLYNIDIASRTITMRPKTGIKTISFEVFQRKFLYSVILMNRMQNALEANHDAACRLNGVLTDVFQTPDGVNVQIKAENIKRGKSVFPVFKMLKIIE